MEKEKLNGEHTENPVQYREFDIDQIVTVEDVVNTFKAMQFSFTIDVDALQPEFEYLFKKEIV